MGVDNKLFEVKNISFSYDDEEIFSDISFSIQKGDVLCILGPNGTGKTTLIKCMNGLHEVNSGEILINGENIKKLSFREISKHIGYIPQSHVPSFPFNVFDVVLMGRAPYLNLTDSPKDEDVKIAEDALKTLGIENLKDKEYTNLSGGERQLVFLARVLCQKPDILILDEPTSHLDFGNQIKLLEIIDNLSKSGLAIIMSSHFPDHAFLSSTKVAIMKDRKFIDFGAPDDVVTEDNLKKAYSIDVKLMELDNKRKVCVPMKTNFQDTGEALRITDADANKKFKDEETKEEMIARFRRTPPEELFKVQKVKIELGLGDMPGKPYTTAFCSVCGEKVSDGRHLLIGGRPVCKSCAEGSYYEIIDE